MLAGAPAALAADPGDATTAPEGTAHHIDCSSTGPGDGSVDSPFTSLDQAASLDLGPGDSVLLKRGTTCEGTLQISGTGSAEAPITIGDYGDAAERAHIEGATAATAVHLLNMEHVILEDLEISNSGGERSARRGVLVQLEDFGTGTGYELRDLDIHDVEGDDTKGPDGAQGIAFRVTGTTPSTFDDVHVHDNSLVRVDRQAMNIMLSDFSCRPEVGCAGAENWTPATNVLVEDNHLEDIGGDGIVLNTTSGAVAQHNVIRGFNTRSAQYNAGLWTYNTDGSLVQYNDTSGGVGTMDGMAYDIDGGNVDNTFQYNLSHDNDGGFFLLCTHDNIQRGSVVRYNISQDDSHRGVENCRGKIESAEVYGNTIHIGDGITQTVINEDVDEPRNVRFYNNIVTTEGSGEATFAMAANTGWSLDHNVLHGVEGAPANPGGTAEDPQLCAPGDATGLREGVEGYRLQRSSPANRIGARVGIRQVDYFGDRVNPIQPDAGAVQRTGC
jgi:hypothetical protein